MLEASESLQGKQALQLTTLQWLLDHHRAKEQERRQVVDGLEGK